MPIANQKFASINIKKMKYLLLICLVIPSLFISCEEKVYTPKPKAYYRMEFAPHSYQAFDTTYPYQFEYSKIAMILPDNTNQGEPYWINIVYPGLNANIYVSYKKVTNNLDTLINDSKNFVTGQIKKAEDIIEYHIIDTVNNVYGIAYEILGKNVACPYQFWLTDNKSKFFRGALYFNQTPNNDSLSPDIDYIKTDILHLFETFSWKNQ